MRQYFFALFVATMVVVHPAAMHGMRKTTTMLVYFMPELINPLDPKSNTQVPPVPLMGPHKLERTKPMDLYPPQRAQTASQTAPTQQSLNPGTPSQRTPEVKTIKKEFTLDLNEFEGSRHARNEQPAADGIITRFLEELEGAFIEQSSKK